MSEFTIDDVFNALTNTDLVSVLDEYISSMEEEIRELKQVIVSIKETINEVDIRDY